MKKTSNITYIKNLCSSINLFKQLILLTTNNYSLLEDMN